jgi:broad specificity phosphatase PhoE
MSVTYLYIRHGPKEYSNGRGPKGAPQHDPHILKRFIPEIRNLGSRLIDSFNAPDLVILSPYLRTRETLAELSYDLPDIAHFSFFDMNISEFLGFQHEELDISIETKQCCADGSNSIKNIPPPGETMASLQRRVTQHLELLQLSEEDIESRGDSEHNIVIWIITHGIVISQVYSQLRHYDNVSGGDDENYYPSELDVMVVQTTASGVTISTLN